MVSRSPLSFVLGRAPPLFIPSRFAPHRMPAVYGRVSCRAPFPSASGTVFTRGYPGVKRLDVSSPAEIAGRRPPPLLSGHLASLSSSCASEPGFCILELRQCLVGFEISGSGHSPRARARLDSRCVITDRSGSLYTDSVRTAAELGPFAPVGPAPQDPSV